MKAVLLGTGTSTGIPVIGCNCAACTSTDPRDTRLRCSCYVETGACKILIDAGPDLRQQSLNYGLDALDAVLITHHHYDHVAGLDDLRPFCFDNPSPIPVYGPAESVRVLSRMYDYIFGDATYPGIPRLTLAPARDRMRVTSRYNDDIGVDVTPIPVLHGSLGMFGYRIGSFAYVTDTNSIPDSSLPLLRDLDVLVLDALRNRPHPTHYTIDEAVEVALSIGARQTYFVHMTHSIVHAEVDDYLPPGISLAYDGLTLQLPDAA